MISYIPPKSPVRHTLWLTVTSLFLSIGFITVVQLCFKLRHSYHMPSSGCCFQEERIIIHPIWVWLYQTLFKCNTLFPRLFPFMHPVQRPSLGLWRSSRAKYRSTHTSSSWPLSHGAADDGLLGDTLGPNTHTQICVHIHLYTGYPPSSSAKWAPPHSEEKVAP